MVVNDQAVVAHMGGHVRWDFVGAIGQAKS